MSDEVEQKIDVPCDTTLADEVVREGQFTAPEQQGTWTRATEGYRTSQKDSASMEALTPEKIAEIKARGFQKFELYDAAEESHGSAEETGTVIDYQPVQVGDRAYALGMDYEGQPDPRKPSERLSAVIQAAAERATDPEGWKSYIQGEVDKLIGIGEGLNIAKESTKIAAVAGWNALTDGTVADFLAKPNAVNDPLFHAVGGALDRMAGDPNAVNHAFEILGTAVMQACERYSALPDREKGHVIGETMFAMINPEGSAQTGEAAQKMVDTVATRVDDAVRMGDESTILAMRGDKVLDPGRIRVLTSKELEEAGIEASAVGAGGKWPVISEHPSADVVQQIDEGACASAIGEMLSRGETSQAELLSKMGSPGFPERLAKLLGPDWDGGYVGPAFLDELLANHGSWGAELKEFGELGHMVVVDGVNEHGNFIIRDPAQATKYEMLRKDFMEYWTGRSVFRD